MLDNCRNPFNPPKAPAGDQATTYRRALEDIYRLPGASRGVRVIIETALGGRPK